jgi:hypothetical protein
MTGANDGRLDERDVELARALARWEGEGGRPALVASSRTTR